MHTHEERQWEGLAEMTALSTAGDVAIPELEMVAKEEVMEEAMEDRRPTPAWNEAMYGQPWSWTTTMPCVGAGFPGHKFPGNDPYVTTSPRITVAGGYFLDTKFQAITRI